MDLSKIYEEYYEQVLITARNFLRNNEDAEDAAQDTFLEAYESLDTYDNSYAISTWLNRICANKCRDKLRRRKLESKSFVAMNSSNEHLLDSQEDPTSPEQVVQAEDNAYTIMQTFLQLDSNTRSALAMRLIDEFSYKKIADELSIPLGTAKTWVRRGRTKLLQAIGPQ